MTDCVFCDVPKNCEVYDRIGNHNGYPIYAVQPLGPVAPGHTLIVPAAHIEKPFDNPKLFGSVMTCAAEFMRPEEQHNIIVNVGPDASQSVFHVHVHLVPRTKDDDLPLPWRHKPFFDAAPEAIEGYLRGKPAPPLSVPQMRRQMDSTRWQG